MNSWLHFINLQYWYCIVYSIFGGHCTYLDELNAMPHGPTVIERITSTLTTLYTSFGPTVLGALSWVWHAYSGLAYTVSGFLAFSILTSLGGLALIWFRDLSTYGTLPPRTNEEASDRTRWQALLEEAKSTDPKRWKDAILGADVLLGELLTKLGYTGLNTGERMQKLPEDAFVTVPVAWEAHRIKNMVSQSSSDYVLTQREAFRVMKLYEQVFEEFQLV